MTAGRHLPERGGCRGDEPFEIRAFERDHQAGIGAELPDAQRQRADEVLPERFGAFGQRSRAAGIPG